MKTTILVTTIVICLVWNTSSKIDPANYIWINYQAKILLVQNSPNQYRTNLPCQSRIGKCSFNYNLLPLNWKAAPDGSLIIPSSDVAKDGMFAIQGVFSEPTGEKINANLVAKIEKGYMSVTDKTDFYNKIGYNEKQSRINKNGGSQYQDIPLYKQQPEDFPDLSVIEAYLTSGDIYGLSRTLNTINSKYAPCKSKINYLGSIQRLINQYYYSNKNKIKEYEDDIKNLQNTLTNLKFQKQNIYRTSGISKEVEDLTTKISAANGELSRLQLQETQYRALAKSTLEELKNFDNTQIISSAQDKDIKIGLQNLTKIQRWFTNAFDNKKILKKAIMDIKLKYQLKNVPNSAHNKKQIEDIQSKYSFAVIKLINFEQQVGEATIKLSELKQKAEEQNQMIKVINKKIAQLESVNSNQISASSSAEKITKLSQQNENISKKIEELQNYLIKLGQCKN